MLILDRTQRTWAVFSGALLALAIGVYCWTYTWLPNGPSGGSLPGLIFGIIAAAMMVYAGLLGARRRFPSARLGSASFWMRSHLWIGTLTVPFALLHAGFGLGGVLEIGLWVLFFAVILSGFWGLALQNILPKLMLENISRETFIQQIPHLCTQFTVLSDVAVASKCGTLEITLSPLEISLFDRHLRPLFEDARKGDRVTYPTNKGESEAVQFNRFFGKLYRVHSASIDKSIELDAPKPGSSPASQATIDTGGNIQNAAEAVPATVQVSPLLENVPTKSQPEATLPVASFARTMSSLSADTGSSDQSVATVSDETSSVVMQSNLFDSPQIASLAKPKPNLAAMRAAELAKKESFSATAAAQPPVEAIAVPASIVQTAPPVLSGDPPTTGPAAKPKPDLAAMRAAALAKKSGLSPTPAVALSMDEAVKSTAATESSDSIAEAVVKTHSAISAKPKPDLAAMRAAALAKKESQQATPAVNQANDSEAAAKSAEEPEQPTPAGDAPASRPPLKGKPDLVAMRAAALAKAQAKNAATITPGDPPESLPAEKSMVVAPIKQPLGAQVQAVKTPVLAKSAASGSNQPMSKPSLEQLADFKKFYQDMIRPFLRLQPESRAWKEGVSRAILATRIRWPSEHPVLAPTLLQFQDYCEQRQQFALIQRYHFWLHGWLMVHIPTTVALYCILLVHIVMALRVVPFGN